MQDRRAQPAYCKFKILLSYRRYGEKGKNMTINQLLEYHSDLYDFNDVVVKCRALSQQNQSIITIWEYLYNLPNSELLVDLELDFYIDEDYLVVYIPVIYIDDIPHYVAFSPQVKIIPERLTNRNDWSVFRFFDEPAFQYGSKSYYEAAKWAIENGYDVEY